jgi:biopolymer transport protein ExbB/TolQ
MEDIIQFIEEGGTFMYVNIVVSVFALATVIDRIVALVVRYNIASKPFMAQITKLVMVGNIERAVKLCDSAPKAALARVVKAGLVRANRGELAIANGIEETTLEVLPDLQKRIQVLWSMANIATLLGLIGTITGLIRAFGALGAASPEQRQEFLSKGIAEAMNNTAFGLIIAVFCIFFHMFLSSISKRIMNDLELYALKLENLLIARASGSLGPEGREAAA